MFFAAEIYTVTTRLGNDANFANHYLSVENKRFDFKVQACQDASIGLFDGYPVIQNQKFQVC